MATRGTFGWGPTWTTLDAYQPGVPTGGVNWEIVTYDGKTRLKGPTGYVSGPYWVWKFPSSGQGQTWSWAIVGVRYVTASMAGDIIIGNNSNLITFGFKKVTTSTFKLMMGEAALGWTEKAVGSTVFTQDTDLIILYQAHSLSNAVRVWVNGVLEIEYTPTAGGAGFTPATVGQAGELPIPSGDDIYYWQGAKRESDAESGRPGTSPTYSIHDPSADTAEDDGLPNGGAGDPNDHDWWDDHAAPDGDTTYLLFDSAAERKHVSKFSTGAALTGNMAALSVSGYRRARPATADKAADSWMRYKDDGGTAKEFAHPSMTGNTYKTDAEHCGDPPAGTWDDYVDGSNVFNGAGSTKKLEMGARTPAANAVNIRITSKGIEVCALDNDPPAEVIPVEGDSDTTGKVTSPDAPPVQRKGKAAAAAPPSPSPTVPGRPAVAKPVAPLPETPPTVIRKAPQPTSRPAQRGRPGVLVDVPIAVGPHTTASRMDADPIFMSRPEASVLRELEAISHSLEKRIRE